MPISQTLTFTDTLPDGTEVDLNIGITIGVGATGTRAGAVDALSARNVAAVAVK